MMVCRVELHTQTGDPLMEPDGYDRKLMAAVRGRFGVAGECSGVRRTSASACKLLRSIQSQEVSAVTPDISWRLLHLAS